MEGEELVAAAAAAAAPVHGHAQQQHQSMVMRADKFPVRVPTGPTLGPDQSSSTSIRPSGAAAGLYLYGGAAPPATTATTTTPTTTATTSAAAAALQPFPSPPSPIPATFESPGMAAATAAAATFRFPFTTAQWQELERQAMIYKYMMAAVPIPPDLLLPSKSCYHEPSSPPLGRGSTFNLRFSNSVDQEPGRCRRTDGKKWRCSRDVAPDQKYCERHMHRGRPRSRKHVEVQARAAQSLPSTTTATTSTTTGSNLQLQRFPAKQSSFLAAKYPFFTHVEQQPRYVDWMNGGGWQFAEQEVGARMRPCYEDSLSLNFSEFGGGSSGGHEQSDQCCIFFNSDLSSGEEPLQKEQPLHFIDAWSISTAAKTTTIATSVITGSEAEISAECKFPMSSLTLSMPSCEEEEQVHMGLGVPESDGESVNGEKIAALSWASAPMPLLGGPLGEVLQSTTSAGSNSLSPHSCGSLNLMVEPYVEGCTTNTHDSPTGVLHKPLASLSDSSGCSSPTFAAGQFAFLN